MSTETANLIRSMRKNANLTQMQASERMGLKSYTCIGNWESAKIEPTFANFVKFAHACGYEIHIRKRDNKEKDND